MIYYVPDIVLVAYGRTQTYQIVCLHCGRYFFHYNTFNDVVCEDCTFDLPARRLEELRRPRESSVHCVGNIVGHCIESEASQTRTSKNFNKVLKRDNYTCTYCGYDSSEYDEFRKLHVDHILPHSFGGSNNMSNLTTACSECNLIAHNKIFTDFDAKQIYILQRRLDKKLAVSDKLIALFNLKVPASMQPKPPKVKHAFYDDGESEDETNVVQFSKQSTK